MLVLGQQLQYQRMEYGPYDLFLILSRLVCLFVDEVEVGVEVGKLLICEADDR